MTLLDSRPCASSLSFLSSGLFVYVLPSSISRMVPRILQEGYPIWRESRYTAWFRAAFSFVLDTLWFFFFHHHLVDTVRFQYSSSNISSYFYYYFIPLRAFHTSISRWSSTGIWVCTPLELFKPALADGPSFKCEWHQVFSGFQNSSRYSIRS